MCGSTTMPWPRARGTSSSRRRTTRPGTYSIALVVVEGVELATDSPVRGQLLAGQPRGYAFEASEDVVAGIELVAAPDTMATVQVYSDGFLTAIADASQAEADEPLPQVHFDGGRVYILKVRATAGGPFSLRLASQAEEAAAPTPPTTPAVSTEPLELVGSAEADAFQSLLAAGLTGLPTYACSDSVGEGLVVDVFSISEAGEEVPLPEVVAAHNAANDGTIHLRISTGACPTADEAYAALLQQSEPLAYWPLVPSVEQQDFGLEPPTGSTTLTPALSGATFDGIVENRLETTFNPADELGQQWTIEGWASTTSNTKVTMIGGFLDINGGTDMDRRWYLSVQNGRACAGIGSKGGECGKTRVNDGTPHHIVLTFDAGTAMLFVDGAEEWDEPFVPSHAALVDHELAVGAMWRAHDTTWVEAWDGVLSSVAIHGRALSAAEIEAHVATGRS